MQLTRLSLSSCLFFVLLSTTAHSKTEATSRDYPLQVTTLASGLDFPWGLAFLPDGGFLISERGGALKYINAQGQQHVIQNVPDVVVAGQGGLLDVALHPHYAKNQLLYLSYVARFDKGVTTHVARAHLRHNRLHDVEVIFRMLPAMRGRHHFGGRLLFDPQGLLYITLGERYQGMQEAQVLNDHLGTLVRIHDDGRVPEDNPFVRQAGAKPEIYTYGHRNIQGIAMQPKTQVIWTHEHGPRGGDELNIIHAGTNYGWPRITYGIDYSGEIISPLTEAKGMAQPVTYWKPSIAPSGMAFYQGKPFAKWDGDILISALAGKELRRVKLKAQKVVEQESLLTELLVRLRHVRVGNDGLIYVLTDSSNGQLLQIAPR